MKGEYAPSAWPPALKTARSSSSSILQIPNFTKDSLVTGQYNSLHTSHRGGKDNHTGRKANRQTSKPKPRDNQIVRECSQDISLPTSNQYWGRKTSCHDTHSQRQNWGNRRGKSEKQIQDKIKQTGQANGQSSVKINVKSKVSIKSDHFKIRSFHFISTRTLL